jgi:hypothetical protein
VGIPLAFSLSECVFVFGVFLPFGCVYLMYYLLFDCNLTIILFFISSLSGKIRGEYPFIPQKSHTGENPKINQKRLFYIKILGKNGIRKYVFNGGGTILHLHSSIMSLPNLSSILFFSSSSLFFLLSILVFRAFSNPSLLYVGAEISKHPQRRVG